MTGLKPAVVLLVLALCAPGGALAGANFNPRPTEALDCRAVPPGTPGAWTGVFHGRKVVEWSFLRKESTFQRRCFTSERACRNWLYNMQSEYDDFVWSANCMRGS